MVDFFTEMVYTTRIMGRVCATMLHRGRIARDREIKAVRELGREDLDVLRPPRPEGTIARLRDSHHQVARLFAMGYKATRVAELSGYSINRVMQLERVPAVKELIATYRTNIVDEEYTKVIRDKAMLEAENDFKAERQLSERLDIADEEGEPLPVRDLVSIARKKDRSTNIQVNIGDFAEQLDRAKKESMRVIEATSVQSSFGNNPATDPPRRSPVAQTPRRKFA